MLLQSKFDMGEIVYLKTDDKQAARMVTKIGFAIDGNYATYTLSCGIQDSSHYESEISREKDIRVTMGIGAIKETA